jgi:hypothetical protein
MHIHIQIRLLLLPASLLCNRVRSRLRDLRRHPNSLLAPPPGSSLNGPSRGPQYSQVRNVYIDMYMDTSIHICTYTCIYIYICLYIYTYFIDPGAAQFAFTASKYSSPLSLIPTPPFSLTPTTPLSQALLNMPSRHLNTAPPYL